MVEDDPRDVELTLTALAEYNLPNEVVVIHDGANRRLTDWTCCSGSSLTRHLELFL
jgi:hypothetical protein